MQDSAARTPSQARPPLGALSRRAPGSPTFLSSAQQRLWLLDQLHPGQALSNLFVLLRLRGKLNRAALTQSLTEVVQRHEALRTTFSAAAGPPVPCIHPAQTLNVPLIDLRDGPEGEREAHATRLVTDDVRRPFDLTQGPLLRFTVLQLGAEKHLLLLTAHPIVFDGWSIRLFGREFATLYDAFSRARPSPPPQADVKENSVRSPQAAGPPLAGRASTLPDLPIQYTDFALWEREWLRGELLQAQLSYWTQQLGGAPAALDLATDRPRSTVPTFQGAVQGFVLPAALAAALKALSRQERVTLLMILLAAFQTLLHRYTGQDDIVVGMPVAARPRAELEGMIGCFGNTLALRTDLSGDPTFRELLGRVRDVVVGAYAHQDVPFEQVVEALQPRRDRTRTPLFQVLFTFQETVVADWPSTDLAVQVQESSLCPRQVHDGRAAFDLTLSVEDSAQGLRGWLEYNTDLFDAASIARMVGHWQTLLEGIVADPGQRLADAPLLTEAERRQVLVEWNATQMDYPADCCIHELFEAQVERTPDAVAVVYDDQQLTYRELNGRANHLAHFLRTLGVGPEVLVGLCTERSLDTVVGLLGILKAGGAYVPLDPTYPPQRLAFMLADAQVPLLLTQRRLRKGLPAGAARVVCLDSDWGEIARTRGENPLSGARADNLAYVIYTSGSTGTPKGVLGCHRAAVNRFHWMWHAYPFEPDDVCCQKTALSFVDSIWEIFGPLLRGIRIVIIPDGVLKDPRRLIHTLAAAGVTRIVVVPSLLRTILDTAPDLQTRLPRLRLWVTSGEALSPELCQRFRQRLPHGLLLNLYGSSEVAADATCYDATTCASRTRVPIGRPIANTQVYLLDRQRQPVPIGVPGELYIGGAGLARGYLNRPDLTAERFIAHPFSGEPGARLYKTGDLARYLPGGDIEFLGRIDNQVKLRGFRIELGEIEAALVQHRAVQEAVVLVREDNPDEKRLVAYVVPTQQPAPAAGELRRFLIARLPEYMVPSAFVPLDALPLTPSGKVDRRALPAPSRAGSAVRDTYMAPYLTVHDQLAQIWEELLDTRPIGIRDSFFDLGGHSLLAARLVERIEQVCGRRLPLATLYADATIEHLATTLLQPEESGTWSPLIEIQKGGSRRPFFFLHADYEGGGFYCVNLARALGTDQPFYALQPHGFDGGPVPYTIEAMAADYVPLVRAVQPEGPYLLGGFCDGGLVALEMARQLRAQGHTVALLALIEVDRASVQGRLAHAVISRLGALAGRGPAEQVSSYLRLRRFIWRVASFAYRDLPERARVVEELSGRYGWADAAYVPRPYPGRVALFWSRARVGPHPRDLTMGWHNVAQDVDVYVIPGSHRTSVTTYGDVLAARLQACLSTAQAHAAEFRPLSYGTSR